MPEDEDGLDSARRIVVLVRLGIHSKVIQAAIDRSVDIQDLRQMLGFIEDLLDMGCSVSDPE